MRLAIQKATRTTVGSISRELLTRLQTASFVSLDTEFSGLGPLPQRFAGATSIIDNVSRLDVLADNVADRYAAIREVATSEGSSEMADSKVKRYMSDTYAFNLFPQDEFLVNPRSLAFLVQHGLDLNLMCTEGIPFTAAGNQSSFTSASMASNENDEADTSDTMRGLFSALANSGKPLVVHNGLHDLMFLWHAFIGKLPSNLDTMAAELATKFKGGIYDTKHIAHVVDLEKASYLTYLHRKAQILNSTSVANQRQCIRVETRDGPMEDEAASLLPTNDVGEIRVCKQQATNANCKDGELCPLSHDLDDIIGVMERIGPKANANSTLVVPPSRKKGYQPPSSSLVSDVYNEYDECDADEDTAAASSRKRPRTESGATDNVKGKLLGHSAAIDSYMTAYIFARMMQRRNGVAGSRNKLHIMGKQTPLLIKRANYI
ncbi:hypothetical protein GQ42DRAFT_181510 [Ramicandelaber brevisporus]|nr:hypothetical protein GQ42DRAFT_181510 [Ramicandelaber brevisporus]